MPSLDIPTQIGGRTALQLAVLHHRLDIASMLLEAGAQTDAQDIEGKTVCEYGESGKEICDRDWKSEPFDVKTESKWQGWSSRHLGCSANIGQDLGWANQTLQQASDKAFAAAEAGLGPLLAG